MLPTTRSLLIHFVRFGPYHLARLRSAQQALEPAGWRVRGLQVCATDAIYAWDETGSDGGDDDADLITLFPQGHYEDIPKSVLRSKMDAFLQAQNPQAVAIAGWGTPDAISCLNWCKKHKRQSILMSETRYADGNRRWLKERWKSHLVRKFDAAIVGGRSHADYLVGLGLDRSKITMGYNVIDNQYFAGAAQQVRSSASKQRPFFLASNRFVPRKNLDLAIEAFAKQVEACGHKWDLCLLGDGPEESALLSTAQRCGLQIARAAPWELSQADHPTVYFPGFRQIDQLPEFYARAGAFFHPAISEPWGLVINEAMACGLPILASKNGGAAEELVVDGQNGLLLDPLDPSQMADAMGRVSTLSKTEHEAWGQRSRELLEERMPTSAFGEGLKSLLCDGA